MEYRLSADSQVSAELSGTQTIYQIIMISARWLPTSGTSPLAASPHIPMPALVHMYEYIRFAILQACTPGTPSRAFPCPAPFTRRRGSDPACARRVSRGINWTYGRLMETNAAGISFFFSPSTSAWPDSGNRFVEVEDFPLVGTNNDCFAAGGNASSMMILYTVCLFY